MRAKFHDSYLHQYVLFQLAQLFICGNSQCRFPKCWNWQIYHAHWAFKVPLHTFSGKLQTFPTVKSKTIRFFSMKPNSTLQLFWRIPRVPEKELPSGHYAAYSRVAGTCYCTWYTWLHYRRFENCWKRFAGVTFSVTDVCIASCLVERGKDKTVRNSNKPKMVHPYRESEGT